jgi:hypothetical protein
MALTGSLSTHPKYATTLFAHDGSSGDDQSGVTYVGRDRSKAAILKRERAEKRALESDGEEEGESAFQTPKVGPYGIFWRNCALTGTRNHVLV